MKICISAVYKYKLESFIKVGMLVKLKNSTKMSNAETIDIYFNWTTSHVETIDIYFHWTTSHVETIDIYFHWTISHAETIEIYF
jgi:hypothetical protein